MSNDKYNLQRKRILEALDKGNHISTMELGMYNLTPYFDMEKFDVSLTEAIMFNKNAERRIHHIDKPLYFSPSQYDALDCLHKNNRVILSAPTSFGKTLLIKEYIFTHKPSHIVYIVPTNALAYELEKSFKENNNFSDYTIFDKDSKNNGVFVDCLNEKNLFFIGTQEKYLEIDKETFEDVALFVIDEAYKLHESVRQQRAYKLSETFLDSVTDKSEKVFLLTPKAKFTGFEKYNFFLYESDFNAVDKNYTVLDEETFFNELLEKGFNYKTILFCASPQQINESYDVIKSNLSAELSTEFVNQLVEDIHPDWSVVKLLKAGILTHHGQMPKYVQNKMIDLFNESDKYKILFGTNSISEGINTSTKNLFIHPNYTGITSNALLLKNTIGRAGRLGEYPIGHIYSTVNIEDVAEKEINISLAISDDEELAEIENSNNDSLILDFSQSNGLNFELCKSLLEDYKISLTKLGKIVKTLKEDRKFSDIGNLPYMANKAFSTEYTGVLDYDVIIIKGYLQNYYLVSGEKRFLNNFNDRIVFFKAKSKSKLENTEIINYYMKFIYSTLEYYIMPIVNIGLDIKENKPHFSFGDNVLGTLEDCKKKYYRKTYGDINYDELSESHKSIINTLKDYGMTHVIKNLNGNILTEIEHELNIRYSTIDVLKAIRRLSLSNSINKKFYLELCKKYIN